MDYCKQNSTNSFQVDCSPDNTTGKEKFIRVRKATKELKIAAEPSSMLVPLISENSQQDRTESV